MGDRRARLSVESWSPEYGSPAEADRAEFDAEVDVAVEREAEEWAPVVPTVAAARSVAFVDGVQRVDARVVRIASDGAMASGVAASVAAGVVLAEGPRAAVVEVEVDRVVIVAGVDEPLRAGSLLWRARPPRSDGEGAPEAEVQAAMADLEVAMARRIGDRVDLVVVDGPIRRREGIPRLVGHIKTHRGTYLPASVARVIGDLRAGQRTPLFRIDGSWSRYAWYLRLPGSVEHDWSAIVRGEAPADLGPEEAIALADVAAATLPRFASSPVRDPRAPQNLVPIGGLETALRHRLGDPQLLYRALRRAAS